MTGDQPDLFDALLEMTAPSAPLPADAHAGVDQAREGTSEWIRSQLRTAITHLARTRETFTSDDLEREAIDCKPNQIGAAMRAARQAGIIEPTGAATLSTRPSAHARVVRVWRAAA
jgi:hypothetical protein